MVTSRQQNVVQNQNIVNGNLATENVQKFKYLGVTVRKTNDIREEIKRRINLENMRYYSHEKTLRPARFPRNLKLIHIKLL